MSFSLASFAHIPRSDALDNRLQSLPCVSQKENSSPSISLQTLTTCSLQATAGDPDTNFLPSLPHFLSRRPLPLLPLTTSSPWFYPRSPHPHFNPSPPSPLLFLPQKHCAGTSRHTTFEQKDLFSRFFHSVPAPNPHQSPPAITFFFPQKRKKLTTKFFTASHDLAPCDHYW